MADRSTIGITIEAFDPPPSPYGDGVSLTRRIEKILTIGNGDDQAQKILGILQNVAFGATVTVDLKLTSDRYGDNLAADDMVLLWCENVHPDDGGLGGENIEVKPGAANGFTNLLGAGSAIKLPAGGFCMIGNFKADKYPVVAGNKTIEFTNTSGTTSATLTVIVLIRQ